MEPHNLFEPSNLNRNEFSNLISFLELPLDPDHLIFNSVHESSYPPL